MLHSDPNNIVEQDSHDNKKYHGSESSHVTRDLECFMGKNINEVGIINKIGVVI